VTSLAKVSSWPAHVSSDSSPPASALPICIYGPSALGFRRPWFSEDAAVGGFPWYGDDARATAGTHRKRPVPLPAPTHLQPFPAGCTRPLVIS
jgi:hypothetical protein